MEYILSPEDKEQIISEMETLLDAGVPWTTATQFVAQRVDGPCNWDVETVMLNHILDGDKKNIE